VNGRPAAGQASAIVTTLMVLPSVHGVQAALRQLAVAPSDALFIHDTPGHVTAAESFGMAGCLHTSTADTITRIEDFLRPL
jgi:putative hydrolase of the HAD superfamily